jgi:hypothetical protein
VSDNPKEGQHYSWFIADRLSGGLNVTRIVCMMLGIKIETGAVFIPSREKSIEIAELANKHMENLK